jgi:hypothetical protein
VFTETLRFWAVPAMQKLIADQRKATQVLRKMLDDQDEGEPAVVAPARSPRVLSGGPPPGPAPPLRAQRTPSPAASALFSPQRGAHSGSPAASRHFNAAPNAAPAVVAPAVAARPGLPPRPAVGSGAPRLPQVGGGGGSNSSVSAAARKLAEIEQRQEAERRRREAEAATAAAERAAVAAKAATAAAAAVAAAVAASGGAVPLRSQETCPVRRMVLREQMPSQGASQQQQQQQQQQRAPRPGSRSGSSNGGGGLGGGGGLVRRPAPARQAHTPTFSAWDGQRQHGASGVAQPPQPPRAPSPPSSVAEQQQQQQQQQQQRASGRAGGAHTPSLLDWARAACAAPPGGRDALIAGALVGAQRFSHWFCALPPLGESVVLVGASPLLWTSVGSLWTFPPIALVLLIVTHFAPLLLGAYIAALPLVQWSLFSLLLGGAPFLLSAFRLGRRALRHFGVLEQPEAELPTLLGQRGGAGPPSQLGAAWARARDWVSESAPFRRFEVLCWASGVRRWVGYARTVVAYSRRLLGGKRRTAAEDRAWESLV